MRSFIMGEGIPWNLANIQRRLLIKRSRNIERRHRSWCYGWQEHWTNWQSVKFTSLLLTEMPLSATFQTFLLPIVVTENLTEKINLAIVSYSRFQSICIMDTCNGILHQTKLWQMQMRAGWDLKLTNHNLLTITKYQSTIRDCCVPKHRCYIHLLSLAETWQSNKWDTGPWVNRSHGTTTNLYNNHTKTKHKGMSIWYGIYMP